MGDRPEHEVPADGVEERPDVQIDHPVRPPAPLAAGRDRIQRGLARPVAVGVRVEHRFHLRLQVKPGYRLGDPVGYGRDGDFILPLLQSHLGWIWFLAVGTGQGPTLMV